ncbi:MAG: flagellar hook protein [Gammaproteobacteria bacterium HGW-Gammaproteobacteria-3]|nr:MAG: flagellar hook protein [Gammaproteobacteria bacterium HGW-Gammaproteobacteria-3]
MAITSLGLGSGLDIRSIVDGLVAAERGPQDALLARQETDLQTKISSFGTFKGALSDFRSSLAGLRQDSRFGALAATSSDTGVLTASASPNADPGQFSIEAKQQAQAHSLASGGFSDAGAVVGTGTLTIKFGATDFDPVTGAYNGFTQNPDQGTLSVTLDTTNNTLAGLRDAINKADAGVNASIINDGSAFRLVLTSTKTGKDNSLQISVDDPSLAQFEFDAAATNLTQTQVAQDAIASINGLDVTSSSNTFADTIKGVSFDLQKAEPGKLVSLNIAASTGSVVDSVQKFVDSFNALNTTIKSLSAFDAGTKTAGILLGDATLRTGANQIRSVLGGIVGGLENASVRTLNDLGVSTQADGTLKFDSGKLTAALAKDPGNVAAVFAVLGRPDNAGVKFLSAEDTTRTGNFAVNVTQAASQGVLTGANGSVGSLTVAAGVNDTFKISVDGISSANITLTAKTYASGDELAAEIQSRINGDASLKNAGAKVQVAFDAVNNKFAITSAKFGADSAVEITQATAGTVGLAVGAGTTGTDVAGTIGGAVAQGDGQNLTAGNGLKLFIDGGLSGDLGSVKFSRGLMEKLDKVLGGLLDSNGSLTAKTNGLQKSLSEIDDKRKVLDTRINQFQARILKQFNAMDALLGQLQATGGFLTQQLAALPNNNDSKQ